MSFVTAETFTAAADGDAAALKACCAAVYGQEWLSLLVGESLHPGGLELTRHLGQQLRLGPADRVLDIACGTGTTSVLLAQEFGCHVTGIDYGAQQIERATAAAATAGVTDRTAFKVGDAESLPFDAGSFTAVICECAFCTFPSKAQAASEMYRVLAPAGRVGITDLTVNGPLPDALQGVAAWVACVADAQPAARYAAILSAAGFARIATEEHNDAIARLIADIQTKLMGVSILAGLGKIDLGDVDLGAGRTMARAARQATRDGLLGYCLLTATRPASG